VESLNSLDLAALPAANVTVSILVLVLAFALVLGAESEAGACPEIFQKSGGGVLEAGAIGSRTRDRLKLRQL